MAEKDKKKAKSSTKQTKKAKPRKKKIKQKAVVEPVEAKQSLLVESVVPAIVEEAPTPKEPAKEKLPKGPKYYGTGRRKEAVAKVWLRPGSGNITVNGKNFSQYFCERKLLEFQVARPLVVANTRDKYDVFAESFGGGVPGQAVAISLGIARALLQVNPDFKVKLKREGLLRRDPRMKERKKYGLKRARKAFQYTKR